jgi:DNA invertase Pin-like site-specific DNA recombinase
MTKLERAKIYAYIRVSTDKQTVENQRFEIERYCDRENLQIYSWIEETISGTKKADERLLGGLLHKLKKGDTLICAELSRLGRRIIDLLTTVNYCSDNKICLIALKDGFDNRNKMSKIIAAVIGICAEMERDMISERTKEALAKRKADGVLLGRKKGFRLETVKLDKYKNIIQELRDAGMSVKDIAKHIGENERVLYRYLKRT